MSSVTPREGAQYPGAPLARGPMGGDQYTQIHNEVFRDPRLSGKAMGIFGYLSTHTEGWRVDEKSVARAMRPSKVVRGAASARR